MNSPSSPPTGPREPTGTARSTRWIVDLATPADGAELAAIYECDDGFPGDIQVLYRRGDNPYLSLAGEGERVVVPVVKDSTTGQIVGMGACIVRDAWVGGRAVRVGYLTGLKLLPDYRRGTLSVIPQVYAFLRDQTSDVDLYYSTILTDNHPARAMLEKKRRRMPEYCHVGTYVTHCYRGGASRLPRGARVTRGTVQELLDRNSRGDLAALTAPPGLTDDDVRLLVDADGTVLAGAAMWDQRDHKEYVITAYGGRYRWLSKLPVHWLGYPRLPRQDVPAQYVGIALLQAIDVPHARALLDAMGRERRDLDFLMVGLIAGHPLEQAMPERSITYTSELYTVHYQGPDHAAAGQKLAEPRLEARAVALDVGFL